MLYRITLHLARSPMFPDGSFRHGYEIVAPLGEGGHLDAQAWRQERDRCEVRRFWAGEPEQRGKLLHRAGGAGGASWVIDYDESTADDDETGYRLGSHVMTRGEYVTISGEEGRHTFRVIEVEEVSSGA